MTSTENNVRDHNNEPTKVKNSRLQRLTSTAKIFNYAISRPDQAEQRKTFMPRALVPPPFPTCDPEKKLKRRLKSKKADSAHLNFHEISRIDGKYKTLVTAHSDYGLPWGHIPRLLMSQFAEDAIQQKQKVLKYHSIFHLCQLIGIDPNGRSIAQAREQIRRFRFANIQIIEFDTDLQTVGEEDDSINLTPVLRWTERRRPSKKK